MNILVSPLDWGLGHASRVAPLISRYIAEGNNVILAGSGNSLLLLKKEFPQIESVELPSFTPRFSKYSHQVQTLAMQVPAFLQGIYKEYLATKEIVHKFSIDTIISDNRYGVRNEHCKSIIITHQLHPRISQHCPKAIESMLAATLGQMLNKFDECYIPDIAPYPNGLAGELTKPLKIDLKMQYIGLLTRLPNEGLTKLPNIDTLCIVSGPEPQRSIFEEKLMHQFIGRKNRCVIVQGLPNEVGETQIDNLLLIPHCSASKLASLIYSAGNIICRSGYSSVMDLYSLGKRAVLIPTPGQAEQEYLATHLVNFGFTYVSQKKIETL